MRGSELCARLGHRAGFLKAEDDLKDVSSFGSAGLLNICREITCTPSNSFSDIPSNPEHRRTPECPHPDELHNDFFGRPRPLFGGAIGVADGARAAHTAISVSDKTRHI
jgi:hypothetical protein